MPDNCLIDSFDVYRYISNTTYNVPPKLMELFRLYIGAFLTLHTTHIMQSVDDVIITTYFAGEKSPR